MLVTPRAPTTELSTPTMVALSKSRPTPPLPRPAQLFLAAPVLLPSTQLVTLPPLSLVQPALVRRLQAAQAQAHRSSQVQLLRTKLAARWLSLVLQLQRSCRWNIDTKSICNRSLISISTREGFLRWRLKDGVLI